MRNWLKPYYVPTLIVCIIALPCEAFFGFGLFFAPGWAKGWPIDVDWSTIWFTGLFLLLLAMMVTFVVGVAAAVLLLRDSGDEESEARF